jgi:hypothetical protein
VRQLAPVDQPVRLYLGTTDVGLALPGHPLHSWRIFLPRGRRGLLGSFRYTIRHGAQLAQNFYRYRGEQRRFTATTRLIRTVGLAPDSDLTAPLWGRGLDLSDAFAFDAHAAYGDCAVALPSTPLAYPYRSKVCDSPSLYIWLSHSDPLARTVEALLVLEREQDPDYRVNDSRMPIALPLGADARAAEPSAGSPRDTAAWLEALFRRSGVGIPRCVPGYCDQTAASAIRTFEFGALEAMLGYRYHDSISRRYADAVAALALKVQVEPDAILRTAQGRFYRPAAAGSYYYAWNQRYRADLTPSFADEVVDELNMPPEYNGIIVSTPKRRSRRMPSSSTTGASATASTATRPPLGRGARRLPNRSGALGPYGAVTTAP